MSVPDGAQGVRYEFARGEVHFNLEAGFGSSSSREVQDEAIAVGADAIIAYLDETLGSGTESQRRYTLHSYEGPGPWAATSGGGEP